MGTRRATTRQERAARRLQILTATADLLEEWSADDVNVDRIAQHAGIAKGTVYLYFRTREELFLEVFGWRHGLWIEALEQALNEARANVTVEDVGRLVVATLVERPLLFQLYGRVAALVSGSVSPGTAHRLLLQRSTRVEKIARALVRRLPHVTLERAERWMLQIEAFLAGFAQFATASRVAHASREPARGSQSIDVESELQYIAATLLLHR